MDKNELRVACPPENCTNNTVTVDNRKQHGKGDDYMSEKMLQTAKENGHPEKIQSGNTENNMDLDILLELGNIGAGRATTALSEIINERILVEVPRLHISPPHLVPKIFGRHDQLTAVIYMQLRGEADCDILLIFEVEEAKKRLASLQK